MTKNQKLLTLEELLNNPNHAYWEKLVDEEYAILEVLLKLDRKPMTPENFLKYLNDRE